MSTHDEKTTTSAIVGHHIMLRCPHCERQYEAEIDNNPLMKNGLMIIPVPIEHPLESNVEQ